MNRIRFSVGVRYDVFKFTKNNINSDIRTYVRGIFFDSDITMNNII